MKRALILSLLLLTSCARSGLSSIESESRVLSAAAVLDSNEPNSVRAEKLAVIADTLFGSGAQKQALEVAEIALDLDSNNVRAGLIRAVAKPVVQLNGFMSRLTLYTGEWTSLENSGFQEGLVSLHRAHVGDAKSRSAGFEDFLWAEDAEKLPKFKTEKSVQDEIDAAITSFDQLRLFAKKNRDTKIAISAASTMVPVLIQRYASACHIVEDSKLVYRLDCPPDANTSLIMFDRADFEMIADVASYYEFALTALNAYDLTGLSQFALDAQPRIETIESLLKTNPSFGKLRAASKLSGLQSLTLDLISGLNWAMANQSTVCFRNSTERINNIFDTGLCMGGEMRPYVQIMSDAAAGKIVTIAKSDGTTNLNAAAFLQHPIQDVRSLMPLQSASDGTVTGVSDQSFGGLFPNNDFNSIFSAQSK